MQATTIRTVNTIRILIALLVILGAMLTTTNLTSAQDSSKHGVMLAILGQTGDESFDNAWFDLANDCTVLAVIDNVNDPISPLVYTRLACQMTQAQIDNAPEYLGDSLLSLTPLFTVSLPVIRD